jgi:hypothetical protein
MIILTTDTEQTFPIIPISQTDLNNSDIRLEFTNETTKEVVTITDTTRQSINDINYLNSNELSFLKENTFYVLRVYFSVTDNTIYKDRVFCTNQPKISYSINNGDYTLPNIDNNFYKI